MLGKGSKYVAEAYKGNFIGVDWFEKQDLTKKLMDNWRDFNKLMIPEYLKENPDKSKIAAGLACGFLWTVSKGIKIGDIVLCPDGQGLYLVGEITGDYSFNLGEILAHRRSVRWYKDKIERERMSDALRNSTGSIGTVSNISRYAEELEKLIVGQSPSVIVVNDETIEDPTVFALEKHLEDFLVENWNQTELGKNYNIYSEDGELVGQQYPSDTGPIDILAISRDKKELLVVELKKGRVSDSVVGQLQRYMGYVKEEIAESNQIVKGVIIALKDDLKLRRSLVVTQNIDFYTYKIKFELKKEK